MSSPPASARDELSAFLLDRAEAAGTGRQGPAAVIETHGALVFLGGEEAIKIKRPVRLSYMDFSTLELRRKAITRELEINRPLAPEIYRDVIAIVRREDGSLGLADAGPAPGDVVVEWALRMHRFSQEALLSALADRGPLPTAMLAGLADTVARRHQEARSVGATATQRLDKVIDDLTTAGQGGGSESGASERMAALAGRLRQTLAAVRPLLVARERAGLVRRCHGDLHLGNIVLLDGRAVPFDALEFDEALATIDVLYDLAFLVMDLDHRHQEAGGMLVLSRYLWRMTDPAALDGMAAMPLLMALRAGIRARVSLDRSRQVAADGAAAHASRQAATDYVERAERYLERGPAVLVAVGGLSGAGKSTLAAALAPRIAPAPGAIVIRSDLERKAIAGVEPEQPLAAEWYSADVTARVYQRMLERAERLLRGGWSVVLDAVHGRPDERVAAEDLARRLGLAFQGLWLEAHGDVLKDRIVHRTGDASDATPAVVDQQLRRDVGPIGWPRHGSASPPSETVEAAARLLAAARSGRSA